MSAIPKGNRYRGKGKALGLALSTTKRHPFGKGAARQSAETLVKKGEKGGISDITVSRELQARANISKNRSPETYRKFSKAAKLARERAYSKGEVKKSHK